MLHEISSARDVQHLAPAADGEHRHVPAERGSQERELGVVALGADLVRLGMRLGAVGRGSRSPPPEKMIPSSTSSVSPVPSATGGTSSARPPARSTARTYASGMNAAGSVQRPHVASSAYVVIPITGRIPRRYPLTKPFR
jgi:hypothetical protein